jgi:hypothetical protein
MILIVLLSKAHWCFLACGKSIPPNEMTEIAHEMTQIAYEVIK